jgi:aminoglycoside phosphotransferase (APT) family kinase protein
MSAPTQAPLSTPLAGWLAAALDDPGPFTLTRLSGGNSNETLLLQSPAARRIIRRPPAAAISASAHDMAREHRVLSALHASGAPVPEPLALCADPDVAPAPFLVMEHVAGHALTDVRLPAEYAPGAETVRAIGEATVDALAAVHRVDWQAAGLEGFGRPEGFLARQVPRWTKQYRSYQVRDLPHYDAVAAWLEAHRPPDAPPGILHSDFRVDNCLLALAAPTRVEAVIDWEMATIGDPMLDLGSFLGFWGTDRPDDPAMPRLQGFSRVAGAPSRDELAARYAQATGRSVEHLNYYMALAFWKLGSIIEGAYAHHTRGRLNSPAYAAELEHGVPILFHEAARFAGNAD